MKTLRKDISEISFFEREKTNGKHVKNKCGRDFLYYALNYYYPDQFSSLTINPLEIDRKGFFGQPVPAWLAWTQIQFNKMPQFISAYGLRLSINDREVHSFSKFINAILFSRRSYSEAIHDIEESVDQDMVSGIDISIGLGGLLDHVIFVYGYDDKSLYVIDTRKIDILGYEEVYPGKFLFKLSKSEILKRWTKFGRMWKIAPTETGKMPLEKTLKGP